MGRKLSAAQPKESHDRGKSAKNGQAANQYATFDAIDGSHPWRKAVPNGYIDYHVRYRPNAKIRFFNFDLAREMGLIRKDHENKLNKDLIKKLKETFSIQIINEYDLARKPLSTYKKVKPKKYMATRYLQLQHPCKKGTTSGDGRSIWNGTVNFTGTAWDISSCGTGVTKLSPGSVFAKKPLKTGSGSSYGSGLAGVDEGLSSAILSEIYHRKGIGTERVLLVLEYPNDIGLTVRASKNLLRPSHMFNHLKQENYDSLKGAIDHFISRQNTNGCNIRGPRKYHKLLEYLTDEYAKFTATLEDEYIFCWLDWDGDNMLATGGIIDYGSIRQFGMFHHKYRYDDVERFSTTIIEQKYKAKQTLQTFAQLVDFLETGHKKKLDQFKDHPCLDRFLQKFEHYKDFNLLIKMGFSHRNICKFLMTKENVMTVRDFRRIFSIFERATSYQGIKEVPDGINCDAIYCMRDVLMELPMLLHKAITEKKMKIDAVQFMEIMASNYAKPRDRKLTPYRKSQIDQFQDLYLQIVKLIAGNKPMKRQLIEMMMRSGVVNRYMCVTGNAIIHVVDSILDMRQKLSTNAILKVILYLIDHQTLDIEMAKKAIQLKSSPQKKLMNEVLKLIQEHKYSI